MLRTVSLLGIAALALAAVALRNAQRNVAASPCPEDKSDDKPTSQVMAQPGGSRVAYHASFSLN
jgi:hypothetical protein